jgi:hypothetical protein
LLDQLCCEGWQAVDALVCETVLNREILANDKPFFGQAAQKRLVMGGTVSYALHTLYPR